MKHRMYATVRRYEGVADPGTAAKKGDEYYWIDLGGGAMISVSIFKTFADAIHANNQSRAWVQDILSDVLPAASRIEAGIIVAHKAQA